LIHVTCFRCRRRFELDPVWVGIELRKLKAKNPAKALRRHYQAHCPACHAVNKVSVGEMQQDLDAAAPLIEAATASQETREETR
jgi:hypothetical protein